MVQSASFWNFALYFNFGISTVEIKFKTQTYFKSRTTQEHVSWKEHQDNDKLL